MYVKKHLSHYYKLNNRSLVTPYVAIKITSTLARLMAYSLAAPMHILDQCWSIISEVKIHLREGSFATDTSIDKNQSENRTSKSSLKYPRGYVLNGINMFQTLNLALYHDQYVFSHSIVCYLSTVFFFNYPLIRVIQFYLFPEKIIISFNDFETTDSIFY